MPFFENAGEVRISGCTFDEVHSNKTVYNGTVHNAPVHNAPVGNMPVHYGPMNNWPRAAYNEDLYGDAGGEHMGWNSDWLMSYNQRGGYP